MGLPQIMWYNRYVPKEHINRCAPFYLEVMMAKQLPLKDGGYTLVDDDIYDWATQKCQTNDRQRWTWRLTNNGYASRKGALKNKKTERSGGCIIRLHREIMGAKEGEEVHHRNGDKLDNRKENLQIVETERHRDIHKNIERVYCDKGCGFLLFDPETNLWGISVRGVGFHNIEVASDAYSQVISLLSSFRRY